jgi:hypothetical protein
MSLSIPLHARIAFNGMTVDDEPIVLMAVYDSTLASPILLCSYPLERLDSNNRPNYGLVSQGAVYIYAITGAMPSDTEGTQMTGAISVDNVSLEYTSAFVGLTPDNEAVLTVVLASDLDTPIRVFDKLSITRVMVDEQTIALQLGRVRTFYGDTSHLEPYPSGYQTWNNAPGLHR